MNEMEAAVRRNVSRVLKPNDVPPEAIDLDLSLNRDYGVTSMKMVLLMTALCEETGVALSSFTDQDIESMETSRDIIAAVAIAPKEAS